MMHTNEKEYNGYLFDQLSLVESIELAARRDNLTPETSPELYQQIETSKRQIKRKLYQDPALT